MDNILTENWQPNWGSIYTWFAMDKNGRIAEMINNNWGSLPRQLLLLENTELLLDYLNDYKYETSEQFTDYPKNKQGDFKLDLYGAWLNKDYSSKEHYLNDLKQSFTKTGVISDINVPINKGFFVYQAVEGYNEGDDYPVGYDGASKMGDYYRYLVPTIFGSIEDFPEQLRHGIAVSDTVDFAVDRLLDNNKINEYFPRLYKK